MRRFAALAVAALLVPLAAQAETYNRIREIWVPAGCTSIATTNSDSFQIRSRYGDVDSYDSFYLSHTTAQDLAYSGDGLYIESRTTGTLSVAIVTFGTGFERCFYDCHFNGYDWVISRRCDYGPMIGAAFLPECLQPYSAIACDAIGDFYVFTGCDGAFDARRYAATEPVEAQPSQSFGAFTDPRYLAAALDGSALWVTADGALHKFAADGSALGSWPMGDPGPVATDRQGNVYAVDRATNTVTKRDPNGAELASWSSPATTGIAIGPYGDVYLLSDVGRVEKWRAEVSTPAVAATWGQVKARWR